MLRKLPKNSQQSLVHFRTLRHDAGGLKSSAEKKFPGAAVSGAEAIVGLGGFLDCLAGHTVIGRRTPQRVAWTRTQVENQTMVVMACCLDMFDMFQPDCDFLGSSCLHFADATKLNAIRRLALSHQVMHEHEPRTRYRSKQLLSSLGVNEMTLFLILRCSAQVPCSGTVESLTRLCWKHIHLKRTLHTWVDCSTPRAQTESREQL